MTRWAKDPPRKPPSDPPDRNGVTDDPLAALGFTTTREKSGRNNTQVYAVSRINPLYDLSATEQQLYAQITPSKNNPRTRSPPSSGRENSYDSLDHPRKPDRQKSRVKNRSQPHPNPPREKTPEIDYDDDEDAPSSNKFGDEPTRHNSRSLRGKSGSSGYGGSNGDGSLTGGVVNDRLRSAEEAGAILEQNPAFVRSIRIAGRGLKTTKSVPSQHSSSSAGGTLTTIPEGRVDLPIPQPIWPGPLDQRSLLNVYAYDSLVDEALLFYTSLTNHNNRHDVQQKLDSYFDLSVKDLLLDLLTSINHTLEGKSHTPEEMLQIINEKINTKLDSLKNNTEEEMKRLCVNLSRNTRMNSVLRAFSHSSSSGHSSSRGRQRSSSSNEEDIYHFASGSSSSGFSDSPPGQRRISTPLLSHLYGRKHSVLSHPDSTLTKGIRNALIYGTLCRHKMAPSHNRGIPVSGVNLGEKPDEHQATPPHADPSSEDAGKPRENAEIKSSDLNGFNCDNKNVFLQVVGGAVVPSKAARDDRPSVWQLYYGMRAEGSKRYPDVGVDPKNVPVFPGGRPETDFTLDVPRSELLSKRLRDDKKWRFRCRVLTSFLGLVFFLLSVMAVSLMLTRGKRMFGSMV